MNATVVPKHTIEVSEESGVRYLHFGDALLHDDGMAGDALDEEHVAGAVQLLLDGLHHLVAPAGIVRVDVDGVGAGHRAGRDDGRGVAAA